MIGLKRALWIIGLAGFAWGCVAVGLIASSDHVEQAALTAALVVAVGWAFIDSGLIAWWRRPDNRVGALMVGVGLTWLLGALTASDQAGWFTAGVLLSNLYVAVFMQLVLVYPDGRFEHDWHRTLAIVGYPLSLVAALPLLLFGLPEHFNCDGCPGSSLQIEGDATAHRIGSIVVALAALAYIAVVLWLLLNRWRHASRPRRRALAPVLWSAIALLLLLCGSLTAYSVGLATEVAEAFAVLGLLVFLITPFALLFEILRSRWVRASAVSDMLQRLSGSAGTGGLQGVLSDALRDPSLELAYWLDDRERWVNDEGRPTELPAADDPRRAWTPVELAGERIGAIVHDSVLSEDPELLRSVAAGAALAVRHERLQAQLRARVDELHDSRQRLAEVAIAERRVLERNLHDGAQQRLVALSITLRLAQAKLDKDPEAVKRLLTNGQEELQLALEELRELARGIHPAVLTDRGLPAAVETLVGRMPLPVQMAEAPAERLPAPVEAAAYYMIAEALTNVAKYAQASHATVRIERHNGHALVEVTDDGIGGADPARGSGLRGLADRVAALDGRLRIESPEGAGTRLLAEIPVT